MAGTRYKRWKGNFFNLTSRRSKRYKSARLPPSRSAMFNPIDDALPHVVVCRPYPFRAPPNSARHQASRSIYVHVPTSVHHCDYQNQDHAAGSNQNHQLLPRVVPLRAFRGYPTPSISASRIRSIPAQSSVLGTFASTRPLVGCIVKLLYTVTASLPPTGPLSCPLGARCLSGSTQPL